MQFTINIAGTTPDVETIEAAIRTVDPAGIADIDTAGTTLRVSAALESGELLELLGAAGHPVDARQLEQVPSQCCGGCSS